jgi:hypothetical protein
MNNARRTLLITGLAASSTALLPGCAITVRAPAASKNAALDIATADRLWAEVLAEHVDSQGRVDFVAIAKNPSKLEQVVAFIEKTSPATHPALFPSRSAVLAYHLNAYNALAMYAVIQSNIPVALKGTEFIKFFLGNRVIVGGNEISLYSYENDLIRKLGEPRIHFALNCMSVGCPRLPQVPFKAETLDAQLDGEAKRFFAEERNAKVDAATKTVALSEILKFYTGDFLAVAPSLIAYANRYREVKIPEDYQVSFQQYDWTINRWPVSKGA